MNPNNPGTNMSPVGAFKYQMIATAKLYEKLSNVCFSKCMATFHTAELGVAEMTCIDRCVVKFMASTKVVSEAMQQQQQQDMQQQAAMQQMAQMTGGGGGGPPVPGS